MRRPRGRRDPPDGLGVLTCPVCWFRMDSVLAANGMDRHPWCAGLPDGSRVDAYLYYADTKPMGG